jgi:hypothetical protein
VFSQTRLGLSESIHHWVPAIPPVDQFPKAQVSNRFDLLAANLEQLRKRHQA